ncbi:hypothetical protein M431DRAFT_536504 [Trichoderma harzianum CBS 226.95]|uniref:Zn(2)-C6 fungal-type domain-containing protein n=1 Tax=Trichoderma harzianum CBS 226.95 TaxID=983964 RepID=A0A2T4ASD4_TRIHA|nr:hypothetical protein M431DRAFT_536504 [Trichoderma harzianum CBS 226.95]PTB59976.1 hypothetical protein M431DRAFT_536504 [Trichoderma harzianum CBS 226.95]
MVGVGGRSRGCKTCRRARVKCGLNAFPVFIDGLSFAEIREDDKKPNNVMTKISTPTVPSNPKVDEDGLFLNYLIRSLFTASQVEISTSKSSVSPWLTASIRATNHSRIPDLAIRACAAMYFGKTHCQLSAVERGAKLYTHVLPLYEMISFSDMNGWLSHFLGIGHLILAYLVRNQRCFLEEDAWKVVPWANDPTSKTTMDCLVDIFCHLPGVVEDMKALKASTGATEELSVSYIILGFQIKALVARLISWRIKWEEDHSNTYFNVGWDILQQLGVAYLDSYPFPTAIFFSEPIRVTELCMYDALLILLQQLWKQLPDYVGLTSPFDEVNSCWPQPSIFLAPGNGSAKEVVGEICKLVYSQFLSHPGKGGALHVMFPLQVAQRSISSESLEAQWLGTLKSLEKAELLYEYHRQLL